MKRTATALTVMLALGGVSPGAAQGPDLRKMKQELEIMKGILQTTVSFVLRDLRQREGASKTASEFSGRLYGSTEINAFYLQGQGAVFVFAMSALRFRFAESPGAMAIAELEAGNAYGTAVKGYEEALRAVEAARAQLAQGALPPVAPEPPKPPEAAPAPTPKAAAQPAPAGKQEDLRKKLFEAQEKVKQRQEDLKARRKKYQEYLDEISAHLVEALANHGDSMTMLRPGEYLNLVLTGGETFGLDWYAPADASAADASRTIVISVQKSVVADYKAGKLTLETFKQKVLQYAM